MNEHVRFQNLSMWTEYCTKFRDSGIYFHWFIAIVRQIWSHAHNLIFPKFFEVNILNCVSTSTSIIYQRAYLDTNFNLMNWAYFSSEIYVIFPFMQYSKHFSSPTLLLSVAGKDEIFSFLSWRSGFPVLTLELSSMFASLYGRSLFIKMNLLL